MLMVIVVIVYSLNRTFMELKPVEEQYAVTDSPVLIEPLWN